MTDLIFYPESARDLLLNPLRGKVPPAGYLEKLTNAMVSTEAVGSLPAASLVVSTKARRRVYMNPKVLDVRGSVITLEVIVDTGASGTLRCTETQYIMIMHADITKEIEKVTAYPTLSTRAFSASMVAQQCYRDKDYSGAEVQHRIINEEWEALLAKYPLLFTDRNLGLSAGVGWWPVLENAFREITAILTHYPGLVFNAVQIKEKFGGLRFYYDICRGDDDTNLTEEQEKDAMQLVYGVVQCAEDAAGDACEVCGQPGKRRDGHWIRTLCDTHAKELQDGKHT